MSFELQIIKCLKQSQIKKTLLCYTCGVFFGFLTHLYMLTNKFPNWDDINNFHGPGVSSLYGRWLLDVLHPLGGTWGNPWVNGSLTIFLLSVSGVLIYQLTELKSYSSAILVPAVMMTFPSVAGTLAYMFTADLYAVGLIFACIGVLFLRKYRLGFLPAFILFLLCLGTYQSYICFSISLIVFGLILDILDGKDFNSTLKLAFISVGTLLTTILVYVPLSLHINPSMSVEGQNGIGNMKSNLAISVLVKQFLRTYKRIFEYFFTAPYSYISPTIHVLNIITVILLILCAVGLFVKRKLYQKPFHGFTYFFLWMMLPPGLAFFYVMSPEAAYSTLMYFQYFLVYPFLLKLIEMVLYEDSVHAILKVQTIVFTSISCLILWIGFCNYILTGSAYLRTDLAKQRAQNYYERLLYALEHTEGYQYGDRYTIQGNFWKDIHEAPAAWMDIDDHLYDDFSGIALEYGLLTAGVRSQFIATYLGFPTPTVYSNEQQQLIDTLEYQRMTVYPDSGCIQKINNIWVIKISDR